MSRFRIAVVIVFAAANAVTVASGAQELQTRDATVRYGGTSHAEIRIALDLAGVADPRYRARRRPVYIDPADRTATLLFQNRATDRTLRVVLPGMPLFDAELSRLNNPAAATDWKAATRNFESRSGLRLENCAKPAAAPLPVCDIVLLVAPLNPETIPVGLIAPPESLKEITLTDDAQYVRVDVSGHEGQQQRTDNELNAGDLVLTVGGRRIAKSADLEAALENASTPREIELIRRGFYVRVDFKNGDPLPRTSEVKVGALSLADYQALAAVKAAGSSTARAIKFTVSFFDDDREPTYANGYFTFSKDVKEQESQTSLVEAAQFAGKLEPALPVDGKGKAFVAPGTEYSDGTKRHYAASARIGIHQNLGDRADADLEIAYRNADFGAKAADKNGDLKDVAATLEASKYQFNVYGKTGFILSAGKFDFAVPTGKLALNESGEGLKATFVGNYSISRLVRRESVAGVADSGNRDDSEWILQGESLTFPGVDFATFNISMVFGEDSNTTDGHDYKTAGAEMFFTNPHRHADDEPQGPVRFRGSAAYYESRRSPVSGSTTVHGEGRVGLVTATWAILAAPKEGQKKRATLRTFTAIAGAGSGDKADTAGNEGYIGENQGFAPDALFLSGLVKVVRNATGQVSAGLANKTYYSAVYTEQQWSPLEWIATRTWLPFRSDKGDIASKATIVRFHRYHFREPVFGETDGGYELNVQMQIENPKGIKPDILIGRYFPGAAMKPVFKGRPWVVSASVSVKIGS